MNDARSTAADWTLAAEHLHVRRGDRTILDDVSLRLSAGTCTSIIGPNGAGKTTLLHVLLGLLRPDRGRVMLDGRDLRNIAPRDRARFAAFVPQNLEAAPPLPVFDVVAGGRYPHTARLGQLGTVDRAAIHAALDLCDLTPLADRRFDTLSGGERQKALLAAALAQQPRLLALDEPTTALDPAVQRDLVRVLDRWHADGGSLLVISHDLQLPLLLGGDALALRDGRIVAFGPTSEVLRPAQLAALYETPFEQLETPTGQRVVIPGWTAGHRP
jgi:iron complex transport system ATP-binding protein